MDIRGETAFVGETATYGFSSHLSYDIAGNELPDKE
jgi:hypothetical protein